MDVTFDPVRSLVPDSLMVGVMGWGPNGRTVGRWRWQGRERRIGENFWGKTRGRLKDEVMVEQRIQIYYEATKCII